MTEVFEAVQRHSGPCLLSARGNLSYMELNSATRELAKLLEELGIRDENIAVIGRNDPRLVVAILGVILSGNAAVPISPERSETALIRDLASCDVNWVVSAGTTPFKVGEAAGVGVLVVEDCRTFTVQRRPQVRRTRVDADDVVLLLSTSGSMGTPKWVMLTSDNISSTMYSSRGIMELSRTDLILITVQLQFSTGLIFQLLQALVGGSRIFLYDAPIFLPSFVARIIEKSRVTVYCAVPANFRLLLAYAAKEKCAFDSLRFVGVSASPITELELLELEALFRRAAVVQMYGLTECAPRVTAVEACDIGRKRGSVGRAVPGVELRVSQDQNSPQGEILVRGGNVMKGYYRNAVETERSYQGGWLRTGDVGWLDEDGYLFLTGRTGNLIISGGVNVYPEEIEQILLEMPMVSQVLVLRADDEVMGEVPVAFLVAEDEVCGKSIREHLRGKTERSKLPRALYQVKSLELTERGKLKRDVKLQDLLLDARAL